MFYASGIERDVEVSPVREQEILFFDLLTFPVIISIANYATLAFLHSESLYLDSIVALEIE